MSEREALVIVVWALLGMTIVGALLPAAFPGLVRYVDRTVLKERDSHGQ